MNTYKSYLIAILFTSFLLVISACEKLLIQPTEGNKEMFEYVWNYTKSYYCCFDKKEIDWEDIYQIYAPQVSDDMDDMAFFNLIHVMLTELEDGMVSLTGLQGTVHYEVPCTSCPLNFDAQLIREFYKPNEGATYTMIDDVAYINNFESESFAEDIISLQYQTDKFIFDLRNTVKDPFRVVPEVCNEHLVFLERGGMCIIDGTVSTINISHRIKKGPKENQYIENTASCTFTNVGKGVVLSNLNTVGGANLAAYLLTRDGTYTHIGDTTGGGNTDICTVALSNGWLLSIPRGTLFLEDGTGIDEGFAPHVLVNDDPTTTDKDEIIEKALELLNSHDIFLFI